MCSNKTEDLHIYIFNMIAGENESKILTKDIFCKCKFDGRKYSLYQKWDNNEWWCECKKTWGVKNIFGILLHEVAKMKNI